MSLPTLQFLLDLAGTFVFALSGAMAGVRRRLDLFGVLVLSFAAANSGGLIRDVIIGATPPAAIDDWRYLGVSLLAGIITFCFPAAVRQQWNPVLVFDAAGLALFAVTGAHKALDSCSPNATPRRRYSAFGNAIVNVVPVSVDELT